jgi:hypothetical protein
MEIIVLILIVAVLVAIVLWAIQAYLPLPDTPKRLIMFVIVILAVLFIIQRTGLLGA